MRPKQDWVSSRLGDICTKIGSGATPRGGKEVYLDNGNFTLIRSQNIYNNRFSFDGLVHISEQQAIANILGTLDSKIEFNRRMNETLEDIAQCLVQIMVCRFRPVRAKMEAVNRLPKHIADLSFP